MHDSFIMHYAYGELGELEEEMRRSFHGYFKKDIRMDNEIGVMLPSSFYGKDSDEFTIEQIVHVPPEYSDWESKNSTMTSYAVCKYNCNKNGSGGVYDVCCWGVTQIS